MERASYPRQRFPRPTQHRRGHIGSNIWRSRLRSRTPAYRPTRSASHPRLGCFNQRSPKWRCGGAPTDCRSPKRFHASRRPACHAGFGTSDEEKKDQLGGTALEACWVIGLLSAYCSCIFYVYRHLECIPSYAVLLGVHALRYSEATMHRCGVDEPETSCSSA